MKRYTVGIPELHYNYITVEADSPDDALKKTTELMEEGDIPEGVSEYSHTYTDGEIAYQIYEN